MNTPFDLLSGEWNVRDDNGSHDADRMARLYEGELPEEYSRYFPSSQPKHVINLIKLAWNDLATQVGRIPDLVAQPQDETDKELKAAGKRERIGMSYLRESEPSGKLLMRILAWWLVGTGRGVVLVKPDLEKKLPIFEVRDPRTCKPTFKKVAGNVPVEVQDLLFRYEVSRAEAVELGVATPTPRGGVPITGPATSAPMNDMVEIYELIDDENWLIASSEHMSVNVKHGLGRVPGHVFQGFTPNRKSGLSLFQDQVSLMVAVSMFVSLKLAAADRMVNPVYWVRGHQGSIRVGGSVLNKLGSTGEMGMLTPPTLPQVDRDIDMLTQFGRVLNRNPEVRQGEIASKGSYTSAKTLEQLSEAIDTVVGEYWDIISIGFRHLYRAAFEMDEKMWKNEKKSISGVVRGNRVRDIYKPRVDIGGRWEIDVNHGFSLGGYQGFLQQLQAKEAGVQSKRRAAEAMPGISDVDQLLREIELERMDEAGHALFMALANSGQLDVVIWSKLREEMARNGTPLHKTIEKYEEEIRAQAQQAVDQGGAEAITAAPGPEAPAEEPLPGIPPSALVA